MSLSLTVAAALWLLLAIPLVWVALGIARTSFNRRQRLLQAAVRSLLLAVLALALARPIISSSTSRQSVVYLVDVSHSISSTAIEAAARSIQEMNDSLRPAHSRVVAFARTAVALASVEELRLLEKPDGASDRAAGLDRGGTDLETALLAARAELAPEHVPRIVLFSDGHSTAGEPAAAILRLAAEHIPVFTGPLAARTIGDAWVEAVELPDRIAAGALFGAVVHVGSQRGVPATIELRSGSTVLASRQVALSRGLNPVALEGVFESPGPHVLHAAIVVPEDPLSANNSLERAAWAERAPTVLYVEGTPPSAKYLWAALTGAGFRVTVRPPSGLPSTAAELDPWDVVVLSDIVRGSITDETMAALAEWVEQGGGGLLVAGGESVFGEKGYRNTPLERLTPVTFERRDEPEVALVIVLDRSWSMAGASMDLTKAAAQAAVDVLSDEQWVGVLTFNDKFDWDVPLRNVGEHRDAIRRRIAEIGPSGHTLIYPAVEQAYLALRDARARARHVILLSDGRSYPGDYEGLLKKMVEARITVSTVAVGPSADPDLLRNLAEWGKGRAYVVADATQVPEIFVKEAKNAALPAFDEKPITPVVRTPAFLTGVDLSRLPVLKGRTATVLKDGALELIGTDEDDPLLAFWQVGLGRSAVFASDVKDRWAADWVTWEGYGPFFASIVRALQRQRTPALALDVNPGPIRGAVRLLRIGVEAREQNGGYRNLLAPLVQVQPRDGSAVKLATRQVAPGRYEAAIIADASQPLTIHLPDAKTAGAGVTSQSVIPDVAAEYRFRPADERLLEAMASATGGAWRPSASSLANTPGDRRAQQRPIWPALIILALVLWFADLLLRRVRLFEPRVAE